MKAWFFAALLVLAATPAPARAQNASHAPVVVELYTSQGCSQCPRANRLLGEFAQEDGIVALTFPVGYWDYLGWNDTFAQPEFTNRQRAYSRAMHRRAPFTPQLIMGGVMQVSASDWDEARSILMEVESLHSPQGAPAVSIVRQPNGTVRMNIGAGRAPATPADVWMVAYDPGPIAVYVRGGENNGRVITHYNLVRFVSHVGVWAGGPVWFERPRCTPQCAVLVQEANMGPMLGAAMTPRERH